MSWIEKKIWVGFWIENCPGLGFLGKGEPVPFLAIQLQSDLIYMNTH